MVKVFIIVMCVQNWFFLCFGSDYCLFICFKMGLMYFQIFGIFNCRFCYNGIVFLLFFYLILFNLFFLQLLICFGLFLIVYFVEFFIFRRFQGCCFLLCFVIVFVYLLLVYFWQLIVLLVLLVSFFWLLFCLFWLLMVVYMNEEVYR